jgi:hypothetical protein
MILRRGAVIIAGLSLRCKTKNSIYAIQTILVLNKDKKVIAKDVPIEKLEKYLN